MLEPNILGHATPSRISSVADGVFFLDRSTLQSSEGLSTPATEMQSGSKKSGSRAECLNEIFLQDLNILAEDDSISAQIKRTDLADLANNAWDQTRFSSKNWLKYSVFGFDSDPSSQEVKIEKSHQFKKMSQQINLFVGENLARDPETDFEKN